MGTTNISQEESDFQNRVIRNFRYGINKDDHKAAVFGLSIFMLNYCMDVKKTDELQDLHFNCEKCLFKDALNNCLVKMQVNEMDQGKLITSMGDL